MMILVVSGMLFASPSRILASVAVSTALVDNVIWNGLDQDEMEAFCGTMEKICRNLEECDFKFDEQEM